MGPSELYVQKSCEGTIVHNIACSHVQLWNIVVYDYVLKCVDLGTSPANNQPIAKTSCEHTTAKIIDCSHVPLWYIEVYDYVLKCIDFEP